MADGPIRELPAFEATVLSPKNHRYCIVIPVINEGERIRKQLENLQALDLPIDVVIADGGSTDGSVEPDYLKTVGVRALLTKKDHGRLSAQLRMAYSWVLDEGYDGVVTVDGNGKDGLDAIAVFCARLDEGYDYAQGSRYQPGGIAENTPFGRFFIGRVIHAPLLSIGAGRRFTDTTNGFRAYSRRYLEDPRVAPFRGIFDRYNLLFYLTVRAPRLGYRCTEVPVRRSYPKAGSTPTKITGLGSKFSLMGEALNAASGAYVPESEPLAQRQAWLPWALLLTILAAASLIWAQTGRYTPDSWAYFELANSFFGGDFYRANHYREYTSGTLDSSAFPLLWPAIWALADRITGLGAYAGYAVNWLVFGLIAVLSELIGRRLFGFRWIGLAAAIMLLIHPGFWWELTGARAIPLQFALQLGAFAVLLRTATLTNANAALMGFFAGLAVLARFDAAPFFVVFGLGIAWMGTFWRHGLCYFAAGSIALSPWIAYSLSRFGTIFATDNSWVTLSTDPNAHVTDWHIDYPPTLFEAPAAWFAKLTGNILPFLGALFQSPEATGYLAALLMAAGIGLFLWLAWMGNGWTFERRVTSAWREQRSKYWVFLSALCATFISYLATGYFDLRYFGPFYWVLVITVFGFANSCLTPTHQRAFFSSVTLGGAILLLVGVLLTREIPSNRTSPAFDDYATLASCLEGKRASPLMVTDPTLAARLSAVHNIRTAMPPWNFYSNRVNETVREAFLHEHGIRYILDLSNVAHDIFAVDLSPLPKLECNLPIYSVQ